MGGRRYRQWRQTGIQRKQTSRQIVREASEGDKQAGYGDRQAHRQTCGADSGDKQAGVGRGDKVKQGRQKRQSEEVMRQR